VGTFPGPGSNPIPSLLSNVATLKRDTVPTNANQANIQPVYEVFANAQGRDLGSISHDIDKIVAEYQKQLSPGNRIEVIGQIDSNLLLGTMVDGACRPRAR
jgi:Cu/Ag efflux pump CusA